MSAAILKPMNAEERERRNRCVAIGCVACLLDGNGYCGPVEYHHFIVAGERAGHFYGVALGKWHHQGDSVGYLTRNEMEVRFGPSLKHNARGFHARYGTDQELLDHTNRIIGAPLLTLPARRRSRGSTATPSKVCPRDPRRRA